MAKIMNMIRNCCVLIWFLFRHNADLTQKICRLAKCG